MPVEAMIQAIGLTKIFRDFWRRPRVRAVEDLDLLIRPGTVFGLLGPNGSGKSTTIKMILGLLYPTRGRLQVVGRSPRDVEVKKYIGYLPEESYLYAHLSARETLHFFGQLFKLPTTERRKRVDMLLEMVGLKAVAERPVGEFSKGMQRRVGLAQALINDPELIILDEPTSGMDPLGTRDVKELLRTLRARGKTILLSSHQLADVEDVSDELAILYGGRVCREGSANSLLAESEMTQITCPRLSNAAINHVRKTIQSEHGPDAAITIGAPTLRLEQVFMDVVKEAQQKRMATAGAAMAGPVAEFLTAERQADQLLASLVQPPPPNPAAPSRNQPATPAPEAVSPQSAALLQSLVGQADSAAPIPARPHAPPATGTQPDQAPPPAVDQAMIDSLLPLAPRPESRDV